MIWILIFLPLAITLALVGLFYDDGLGVPLLVAVFCGAEYTFLMFPDAKGWMRLPGMEPTEEEMEQTRQRVKELKESGEWEGRGLSNLEIGNKLAYGTLVFLLSITCYVLYWFFDDSY